jgi:hypothetical protein
LQLKHDRKNSLSSGISVKKEAKLTEVIEEKLPEKASSQIIPLGVTRLKRNHETLFSLQANAY